MNDPYNRMLTHDMTSPLAPSNKLSTVSVRCKLGGQCLAAFAKLKLGIR
jgi:hypothetical protein